MEQDSALPDVLENGNGLRVGEALERHAIDGQDFVTCKLKMN